MSLLSALLNCTAQIPAKRGRGTTPAHHDNYKYYDVDGMGQGEKVDYILFYVHIFKKNSNSVLAILLCIELSPNLGFPTNIMVLNTISFASTGQFP